LSPLLAEGVDLRAAHLIDRIAHVLGDVKAVQDVERIPGLLGHDLQMGLPHVAKRSRPHATATATERNTKPSS